MQSCVFYRLKAGNLVCFQSYYVYLEDSTLYPKKNMLTFRKKVSFINKIFIISQTGFKTKTILPEVNDVTLLLLHVGDYCYFLPALSGLGRLLLGFLMRTWNNYFVFKMLNIIK